jgi:hypothetical protein
MTELYLLLKSTSFLLNNNKTIVKIAKLFSHIMKIYHKEHAVGPIRVEEDESSYSPYGDGQFDKTEYYECYEDIVEEIKSHFGL